MAFGNLAKAGLAEFLSSEKFSDELCVFLHIPKTAGTSLSNELENLRPPYINIHRKYFDHGEKVTFSRIEDEIDAVVNNGALAKARSCSGHFSWSQAAPIRKARDNARFFTFLRDPVKRIISDFRYSRTPAHPTYKETIARFPTIEDYVTAPETQDKMARFLMPDAMVTSDQIADFIDNNYAFVGLLEMYPLSFNILARMMGQDAMPSKHRRKTQSTPDNMVAESSELVSMIVEHNPRDQILYEHARQNLRAIRDEWRAMRQRQSQTNVV